MRLDHRWRGVPGLIASYLVRDGGEVALVEAGPGSTTENLLTELIASGTEPAEVTAILLTHIHLDHAGGTGALLRALPNAVAHVHPEGAPHLVDPARLLASAERVFGAEMESLWGETLPVDPSRIRVLADGGEIRVGRRTVAAIDTPGHAHHHLAFHLLDGGVVFTGDVAGVRIGGIGYVRPPTVPPEFQPETWSASLARLAALHPRRLLLTHFGGVDDVAWHLRDLGERLEHWSEWCRSQSELGVPALEAALRQMDTAELANIPGGADAAPFYDAAVGYGMMAAGLHRWRARGGRSDASWNGPRVHV